MDEFNGTLGCGGQAEMPKNMDTGYRKEQKAVPRNNTVLFMHLTMVNLPP